MQDAHGAVATAVARPDEKSEIAPGRTTAKAATAAAEAADAAIAERTSRRRNARGRSPDASTMHSAVESWIALERTAISRDHVLQAAHSSR
jgi:hypothetical protein